MVCGAMALAGQEVVRESRQVTVQSGQRVHMVGDPGEAPPMGATFGFIAAAHAEPGKVVKNAPYAAEGVSETVRTLADGTRIVNKHSMSMARDKEGRVRRENNFGNIGPWVSSGQQPPRFVTITDPVAKEVFVLNLNDRSATRSKMGEPMVFRHEVNQGNRREVTEQRVHVATSGPAGGQADVLMSVPGVPVPPPPGAGPTMMRYDSRNAKTENLGRQVMEGVPVEGTRTTDTIPAGEIGNDRPIVSTTERWYSADLQMVIHTKTIDPQFGETSYRVSQLRRAEPDPSLFRVPADFRIQDAGPSQMMRFRSPAPPPPQ